MHGLCKSHGSGETMVHAPRDLNLDILEGELIVLLMRPAWGASGSDHRGRCLRGTGRGVPAERAGRRRAHPADEVTGRDGRPCRAV
jgi:hypothetical protein